MTEHPAKPVDFRTAPSKITPVTTAWQAWWEGHELWDGEVQYTDLATAQHHAGVDYVGEEYSWVPGDDPADEAPQITLTWVHKDGCWTLLDNGQATGVLLYETRSYAAEPASDVVVLCGSMRFAEQMAEAAIVESVAGALVLKPDCNMKTPHPLWSDPAEAEALKARLDDQHRQKIRIANRVLVVGDYIGDSTRSEIAYARQLGKPVAFTHPEVDPGQPDHGHGAVLLAVATEEVTSP